MINQTIRRKDFRSFIQLNNSLEHWQYLLEHNYSWHHNWLNPYQSILGQVWRPRSLRQRQRTRVWTPAPFVEKILPCVRCLSIRPLCWRVGACMCKGTCVTIISSSAGRWIIVVHNKTGCSMSWSCTGPISCMLDQTHNLVIWVVDAIGTRRFDAKT